MNVRTRAAEPAPGAATRPLLTFPIACVLYFGLAVLYFLPAFLPGQQIYGTDWLVGGFFFHEFISERFAAGELPQWVPYVYGGLPLFANPGSTYYPFRFLADLVFPVSRIWPALFVIHFTLAGAGMYLLARELRARPWVALVGGLAFQFTGLTMSWVLAGHEGRIIVATLTPLVFYFLHRGIKTARPAPFVGAAAAVGFALLTFQIQSSYYMLLGALLWSLFSIWQLEVHRDRGKLLRVVAMGIGAVAFGFALAAVNFLPFIDYVEQSPRGGGGRGYEYAISYSMPVSEVAALAFPEAQGFLETYRGTNPFKLHIEYVGAVVLVLVALGAYYARRNRYWWFFLGLGLFALSISLGGNTPLYRLYYELLPATRRFRAPSISFFLVSLALVAMATLALEALAQRLDERAAARPRGRAAEAGAIDGPAGWILVGTLALGVLGGAAAGGAYRFVLFAALAAGALWLWLRGSVDRRAAAALLGLIVVVDLWMVDRHFFQTVPGPDQIFAEDDVARFLATRPEPFRAWVLPFPAGAVYRGQPGNYLMHFDVHLAGGEHGNQLHRWNEYAGTSAETYVDWHNFLQHPVFLDAANIRYIVTGAPLEGIGLPEAFRGVGGVVYENPTALPRAYLVGRALPVQEEDAALEVMKRPGFDPRQEAVVYAQQPLGLPEGPLAGEARVTEYEPDRVVVRYSASREALLVLADNFYQGWEAEVDGREAPIVIANHTMRGVVVPEGEHTVTFTYRPQDLYTGFAIYLVGMAALALYALFLLARRLRSRRAGAASA